MHRFILVMILAGLAGCSHVLSQQALDQVDSKTDFAAVRTNPAANSGKTLLLGGVIMGLKSGAERSTIEIYRWKLDRWGEPVDPDDSGNRFLVIAERRLDPERYATGRLITLVASVKGEETRPLGRTEYTYPVFHLKEDHVWETPFRTMIHPGPNYFAPSYVEQKKGPHSNPYDPGFNPYPYTPYDLRLLNN